MRNYQLGIAFCGALVALNCSSEPEGSGSDDYTQAPNAVVAENKLPGDSTWLIQPNERSTDVHAYASPASFNKGSAFAIRTSSKSGPLTVDVYRVGWYGGVGGRKVYSVSVPQAAAEHACNTDLETGLIECDWPDTFKIPGAETAKWMSGVFLARVRDANGKSTYAFFVVYDSKSRAPILAQLSTTTYQVYNQFGGASLYGTESPAVYGGGTFKHPRGVKVSFNRPYGEQTAVRKTGWGVGDFFNYDAMLLRFVERNGYDVSYITNVDVDQVPNLLDNHRLMISMGHDEYWSTRERNAVQTAVQSKGMNLAVFSGNSAYWNIRIDPSTNGKDAARTVTCYRSIKPVDGIPGDPVTGSNATVLWRNPPVNRPETQLLGVAYPGAVNDVTGAMFVSDPAHWVFKGTNLALGDSLPSFFGHETDIQMPGSPKTGITAIANSYFPIDVSYKSVSSDILLYQASPQSGIVFEGATTGWTAQLGDTPIASAAIQRMTANVLDKLGGPPALPFSAAAPVDTGVTVNACNEPAWKSTLVQKFGPLPMAALPRAIDYAPGKGLLVGFPGASHVTFLRDKSLSAPLNFATPWPVAAITHDTNTFYVTGLDGSAKAHVGAISAAGIFTELTFANAALSGALPSSIAFTALPTPRLYVGCSHDAFVHVDLEEKTAVRATLGGKLEERAGFGQSAISMLASPDGTLVALLGQGHPQDLVRIDPRSASTSVASASPAYPMSTLLMSQNMNAAVFGRGYSHALNSWGIVQGDANDFYLTRAGTADVAHLTLSADGSPSLCSIAGTGKRGRRVGAETDLPVPTGITRGPNGSLYVADSMTGYVLRLDKP